MSSIRPLHDRIIIKRSEPETRTASGIVIPDSAGEKPEQGEVLAVGPGKRDDKGARIAPDVQLGDKVLFGKYAGQTVKLNGNEVLVLSEQDILGVIEA
jgi:chaperonin GroES